MTKKKAVMPKKSVKKAIVVAPKSPWAEIEKGTFGVRSSEPRVSIYLKRGLMRLNSAFLRKFDLEKATHVKVLFNDTTSSIGIIEAGVKDANAMKLLNKKPGVGAVVSCKKLVNRIKYDEDFSGQVKTLVSGCFEEAKFQGKSMVVFQVTEFTR